MGVIYSSDELAEQYSQRREDDEEQHVQSQSTSSEETDVSRAAQEADDKSAEQTSGQDPGSVKHALGAPPLKEKVGFFHPSLKTVRKDVCVKFALVWFLMACLVIAMFSLYWGSLYKRPSYYHRLQTLIVIEDDAITDVYPSFGNAYIDIINSNFSSEGDFTILNGSQEIESFFGPYTNLTQEIITQVHHRKYWTATHIFANATLNQLNFYKGDISPEPAALEIIYESGRDPAAMPSIVGIQTMIARTFTNTVFPTIAPQLLKQLSSDQLQTLFNSTSLQLTPLVATLDYRPFSNSILIAPLQVGLIFIIISSFFLFNFFGQVHAILLPHIKIQHYLLYRTIGNHISYLVLSLFISTVSAIFQIDFTLSVGKAGFVVFWLSNYLTMAAVGGANENVCMVLFAYYPPLLGFWLLSFVILNIAPTFSPMALTNVFYRYGYAFPIHQANEIFKVLLLNLWKGHLGRNYGILVVWIALNTILMPFCLKFAGKQLGKKAAKEKAAAEAAREAAK